MANQPHKREPFRLWYPFCGNASSRTPAPTPRAATQAPTPPTQPSNKRRTSRTPLSSPTSPPPPPPSSSPSKQNQSRRVSPPSRRPFRSDQINQNTKDESAQGLMNIPSRSTSLSSSQGGFKTGTSKSHLQKVSGFIVSRIHALWELFLVIISNIFVKSALAHKIGSLLPNTLFDSSYCMSWRLAVETNNAGPWPTVPMECVVYVERYMLGGQYNRDLETVMEMIGKYLDGIEVGDDGMDAWVLDVDETCLSNIMYYQRHQFGGMPFNIVAFTSWVEEGMCSAIFPVLGLFNNLIERGYKVFLLTSRDDTVFRAITTANLQDQEYIGYERLIMRTPDYKGIDAKIFKSVKRKQLIDEGYRLRGNVGDQWSDLQGDYLADRNFKIPNPMYFIP